MPGEGEGAGTGGLAPAGRTAACPAAGWAVGGQRGALEVPAEAEEAGTAVS